MSIKDIFLLGELFYRVQMEEVFTDGKTFVDCTPLISLDQINNLYNEEKESEDFDLNKFIHQYFKEPEAKEIKVVANRPILTHLNELWDQLTRQPETSGNSLIALPHQYIIPGGRFREIYYWDSYFTMLGLQVSKRIDIITNMIDNFAFLIDQIGFIPNGNRTYYLGRSQPPFFSCMVSLLSEINGKDILLKYLPQLLKEHDFFIINRSVKLDSGKALNIYSDKFDTPRPESFKEDYELITASADPKKHARHLRAGAESGWDFSSRWFKVETEFASIHTTDIVPIDLNCLLYHLEKTIAAAYQFKNNEECAAVYEMHAERRKREIERYCWNYDKGFYFDYDHVSKQQKESYALAAAYPLFFKIATHEQAKKVADIIEQKFLRNGGLVTTLINTGQQWDAPNGWAPLQWIAIQGLINYGFDQLAKDIATRWMALNENVYKATGKMMEKYNVEDITLLAGGGEYPAQDGFGWTNGVYLKLHSMFGS